MAALKSVRVVGWARPSRYGRTILRHVRTRKGRIFEPPVKSGSTRQAIFGFSRGRSISAGRGQGSDAVTDYESRGPAGRYPLDDITVLERPDECLLLVLKGGKVFKNALP
jgi:hypothetical protein